jgi:hypothetical protein
MALVGTDVLEERTASTIRVEAIQSSETSVLARTTRRRIPKDGIFIVNAVKT